MSTESDGLDTENMRTADLREQVRLLQKRLDAYEFAARPFEDLFQSLPVACYTYDAEGMIHDWNKAAENLWGFLGRQATQSSI